MLENYCSKSKARLNWWLDLAAENGPTPCGQVVNLPGSGSMAQVMGGTSPDARPNGPIFSCTGGRHRVTQTLLALKLQGQLRHRPPGTR